MAGFQLSKAWKGSVLILILPRWFIARAWGMPLYQLGIWLGSNIIFFLSFESACRIARGREETSTSGRLGGRLKMTPSASNIISSLTMEELMAYCEVPDVIDLRLMESADESTLGGEHNGVFFTGEHLVAGLRFPVLAIVKQFFHFTRVPPALIHPNVIRILIDSCVLNHLYQLNLTLVEIFMIYFLSVGPGGRVFMSVLSP